MFEEKGHRGMALTFYLTGKERSGVVAVKVQKVTFCRLLRLVTDPILEHFE